MHLVCVQVFEKVTLLTLIITDIESISSHVLLLTVEILHHRQGVIIWTLLHHGTSTYCLSLLNLAEAILVLYLLTWRMAHRCLHYSIRISFHDFLPGA